MTFAKRSITFLCRILCFGPALGPLLLPALVVAGSTNGRRTTTTSMGLLRGYGLSVLLPALVVAGTRLLLGGACWRLSQAGGR